MKRNLVKEKGVNTWFVHTAFSVSSANRAAWWL